MCEIPPTERVKQTTRNETTYYGVRLSTKILGRGPGNVASKIVGQLENKLDKHGNVRRELLVSIIESITKIIGGK